MEFGVVSFDGFSLDHHKTTVTSNNNNNNNNPPPDFSLSKLSSCSNANANDNDYLSSPSNKTLLHLSQQHPSSFSLSNNEREDHRNMLSFSSPPKFEDDDSNKNLMHNSSSAFFQFQHSTPTYTNHNAGGYSRSKWEGMYGRMRYINGVKWPFTTSQWLELEQQALIYKYILANHPIPSTLLIPIQTPAAAAAAGRLITPSSSCAGADGWSPFHFGLSNSTDPEPGRCRRTDGKKWRCSRDAVPDQKYCERHINRGRHRSRKPVEPRSGVSLIKPTPTPTPTPTTTNKNSSSPHFTNNHFPSSTASNITVSVKESLSPASNPLSTPSVTSNRGGLDFLSPRSSLNSRDSTFLNEQSRLLWGKAERSELSISIPVPSHPATAAAADYRSSTSSPTGEKVTLSPLRLEVDPVGMMGQRKQFDSGWEMCVGGPLGEVLKPTSNSNSNSNSNSTGGPGPGHGKGSLSEGWEVVSPQIMCSSPKRTAQGSFSNSSAGSSSRETSYVAPYL